MIKSVGYMIDVDSTVKNPKPALVIRGDLKDLEKIKNKMLKKVKEEE